MSSRGSLGTSTSVHWATCTGVALGCSTCVRLLALPTPGVWLLCQHHRDSGRLPWPHNMADATVGPHTEDVLAGRAPAELAAAQLPAGGQQLQLRGLAGLALSGGGTPRGPVPMSRLGVVNSFPGSHAGAGARAGSQPSIPGGFLSSPRPPLVLHPVVMSHLGACRR